jgi:hypothetical protein
MSFHIGIELRRGLFYARLPLVGELCWTAFDGWRYSRPSQLKAIRARFARQEA